MKIYSRLIKAKTKPQKELIIGRIIFEYVQFQLDMTYIEYFDLSRRDITSNPFSDFDYFDEVQGPFKKAENTIYWLGYAGSEDVKILNPKWVEEGTIFKDGDLLFPTEWQEKTKGTCASMRIQLNEEITNNIKEYTKHSGYHPDDLIESIGRGFDTSENSEVVRSHCWSNRRDFR